MEEWMQLVQAFGFPVAMCAWFMFRTEKVINNNTQSIDQLKMVIMEREK